MGKFRVHADVGHSGDIVGVPFVDGTAEVDPKTDLAALAYFRRHGYRVEEIKAKPASRSAQP